jgi:aspartokinase/homoserine dehydrogenase 1
MKEQLAELKTEYAVDLRVVAITGNARMLLTGDSDLAIDLEKWEGAYQDAPAADMEQFTQHVQDSGAPNQVIIDCSASEVVAGHYKDWLKRGINVVTPNKKANSGPLPYYKELRNIQRNGYKPLTLNPELPTPNSKPQTPNPKPQTPNPKPQTPNPKP